MIYPLTGLLKAYGRWIYHLAFKSHSVLAGRSPASLQDYPAGSMRLSDLQNTYFCFKAYKDYTIANLTSIIQFYRNATI